MTKKKTILATWNATVNHKLKLVAIGKSAKPRSFKNIILKALPVTYTNQKKCSWMDKEWIFLRNVFLPYKAVLLMDTATLYTDEEELQCSVICTVFLPNVIVSYNLWIIVFWIA